MIGNSLLSEMHAMSDLILSSIKKIFRSLIWTNDEEIRSCKSDKSSYFTLVTAY